MYGRIEDGVAVPVEEGLIVDWDAEDIDSD